MLSRIFISLALITTANLCLAMEQPKAVNDAIVPVPAAAPKKIYVPLDSERFIVENALIKPPYPPLTKWLMRRYWKVISHTGEFPGWIVVRHDPIGSAIRSVAISPDGSKVVTGCVDGTVKIWDAANGRLITTLVGTTIYPVDHIEISPDGSRMVTVGEDCAKIWKMDGSFIAQLSNDCYVPVRISSDSTKVAAVYGGCFDNGGVKIWNLSDGTLSKASGIIVPNGTISSIRTISPDLSQVCSLQVGSNCVKIWNTHNRALIHTIKANRPETCPVQISPDGSQIITGSRNSIDIWNITDGQRIATLPCEAEPVLPYTISPDGFIGVLAGGMHHGGGDDREIVKVWDMHDEQPLATLFDESMSLSNMTCSVAVAPHGLKAVTGHANGTFVIWDVVPAELLDALATVIKSPNPLKQVQLLEWLHECAAHGKKADFSKKNREIEGYIEQYQLLPQLIKDLTKEYIKFE